MYGSQDDYFHHTFWFQMYYVTCLQKNPKDFLDRAQSEQVNKIITLSGRPMAIELCEETKLKYFAHLKRSEGLGMIILEGRINQKRERGRPRRQLERNIEDAFTRPITEAGR